jgi:hypothetical protein
MGLGTLEGYHDSFEWMQQAGNPVAYAPHLRKGPLPGMPEKHVIFRFSKGDQTVPSPTTTGDPARGRPRGPRHLLSK